MFMLTKGKECNNNKKIGRAPKFGGTSPWLTCWENTSPTIPPCFRHLFPEYSTLITVWTEEQSCKACRRPPEWYFCSRTRCVWRGQHFQNEFHPSFCPLHVPLARRYEAGGGEIPGSDASMSLSSTAEFIWARWVKSLRGCCNKETKLSTNGKYQEWNVNLGPKSDKWNSDAKWVASS